MNAFLIAVCFMNNQFGVSISENGSATNCIFSNNGTVFFHEDNGSLTIKNSLFCNNTIGIFSAQMIMMTHLLLQFFAKPYCC